MEPEQIDPKPKMPISKNAKMIGFGILGVAILGGLIFVFLGANTPEAQANRELQEVISKVGRLIVLPEGETPTLATVEDPSKLAGQPFFANAEKGDHVLIYPAAKKAILYSESLRKIIEVAPLNIGQQP